MSRRKPSFRTAVTLPDFLLQEAEAVAKDLGVSRSRLMRAALEDFLKRRREHASAQSTEECVAKHGSGLSEDDEAWLAHNRAQLRRFASRDESARRERRKPAVSLPAALFEAMAAAAKDRGSSRSALMRAALSDFLGRHRSSETTRRLNKSYIRNPPEPDPFLDALALKGMRRTEWKE